MAIFAAQIQMFLFSIGYHVSQSLPVPLLYQCHARRRSSAIHLHAQHSASKMLLYQICLCLIITHAISPCNPLLKHMPCALHAILLHLLCLLMYGTSTYFPSGRSLSRLSFSPLFPPFNFHSPSYLLHALLPSPFPLSPCHPLADGHPFLELGSNPVYFQ